MPESKQEGYYIGAMDDEGVDLVISLAHKKRKTDKVTIEYKAKNFKNHMKAADKADAKYFCIIGSNEIQNRTLTIKNLEDKSEQTIKMEEF
jgi:histidyl-tRNA synthetase